MFCFLCFRFSMHYIIILIALSLIRDCEPDEIVAWDVPRRFCSSDIPNIMRLVCRPRTRNLPLRSNTYTNSKHFIYFLCVIALGFYVYIY